MLTKWFIDNNDREVLARQDHKKEVVKALKSLIAERPKTLHNRSVWLKDQNTIYYNLINELGEIVKITANAE